MALAVGPSPASKCAGPGSEPRPTHVQYVVDQAAMAQVILRVLRFFPVSVIPQTPRNLFQLAAQSDDKVNTSPSHQ